MRYYSSTAVATALTGGVDSSALTLSVETVAGMPIQVPFTVVIDPDTASEEAVSVTGVSGTFLTVVRGEDGTPAQSHTAGAVVRHMMTARDLREPQQHIAATVAHGTASAVVGISDIQVLTNKTLNSPTLNTPVINTPVISGATINTATLTSATLTSPTINTPTINTPVITSPPSNVANPAGAVTAFAGASAPSGWLLCNGAAVSRTSYAALFAVCGTTYGAGDGSTTFNLPNLKSRVPVGLDAATPAFDALGETGGEAAHTLTAEEIAAHSHPNTLTNNVVASTAHDHPLSGTKCRAAVGATDGTQVSIGYVALGPLGQYTTTGSYTVFGSTMTTATRTFNHHTPVYGTTDASASAATTVAIANASAGGGQSHNNLQPYLTMNYIIKT